MSRVSRRGFTLIELIAGLSLSGIVFVSMLLLVDQLRDGRDRLLRVAQEDNRRANGWRVLHTLVARAEVQNPSVDQFAGTGSFASFASWCDAPSGWIERCRVFLAIESADGAAVLRARLSTGERIDLVASPGALVLRYYDASEQGRWVASWLGRTLPSAVALIAGGDTVVIRAGGRG